MLRGSFTVSPGLDPAVVDWCLENGVVVTPGVVTPTEITLALNEGLRVLKFFPAEASGGVKTLKAIGGPFTGVKFIPTGGFAVGRNPTLEDVGSANKAPGDVGQLT